jgi:hypothetical protein
MSGGLTGEALVTVDQFMAQNWVVIMLAAFAIGVVLELGLIGFLRRKGKVPLKDSALSIFLGLASDPVNAIFALRFSASFSSAKAPACSQ